MKKLFGEQFQEFFMQMKNDRPDLVLNNVARSLPQLPKHTTLMLNVFKVSLLCPKHKQREP